MILVILSVSFLEISNYYQIGNTYLQFELTLQKNGGHFEEDNTDLIRLVSNALAHLFTEATIA